MFTFVNKLPIRLISVEARAGTVGLALNRLNVEYEHYRLIDTDEWGVKLYNALHGTSFEPRHIVRYTGKELGLTDLDEYLYIFSYTAPPTEFLQWGKRGSPKKELRGQIQMAEIKRILQEADNLPQVLIMENSPEIHLDACYYALSRWCGFLSQRGYTNYCADVDTLDYGTKRRIRNYLISVRGYYKYDFPEAPEPPLSGTKRENNEINYKYLGFTPDEYKIVRKTLNSEHRIFTQSKKAIHVDLLSKVLGNLLVVKKPCLIS